MAAGCEQKKESRADEVITTPTPNSSPTPGCYRMVIAKDTALMQLTKNGDSLQGTLAYRRYEKDSNKGTVTLHSSGDKATGWYNFQSEGMNSVRQITFKVTDSSFAEAYGDIVLSGDSATYKYPSTLKFEDKHPFVKLPCN